MTTAGPSPGVRQGSSRPRRTPQLIAAGLGAGATVPLATVDPFLDAVPPALREALLAGFPSLLQRPAW